MSYEILFTSYFLNNISISFLQFISEAETQASSQAKNMGLSGDGHGDWYDKQGKLVAKTVNGRLKFFGNRNLGKKIEPQTLAQPKQETPKPEKNKEKKAKRVSTKIQHN